MIAVKEYTSGAEMLQAYQERRRKIYKVNRPAPDRKVITQPTRLIGVDHKKVRTMEGPTEVRPLYGRPSLKRIERLCRYWLGIKAYDFHGDCRTYEVALCRQLFCKLARSWNADGRHVQPRFTTAELGRYIGRDHTTVIHAVKNWDDIAARHRKRRDKQKPSQPTVIKAVGMEEQDEWNI
jgi:hypothetical protein